MPVLYSRGIERQTGTKISCIEIIERICFSKFQIPGYVSFSGFSVPDFKNKTGIGVICCFTGTKKIIKAVIL
jgi:hypothetical protein